MFVAQVPTAVARYLADQGLPLLAVATGDVAGFDWPGAGVEIAVRVAVDADKTGISGCFCAIAETGTLEADTAKKLKDAAEKFVSSFNQKVKA